VGRTFQNPCLAESLRNAITVVCCQWLNVTAALCYETVLRWHVLSSGRAFNAIMLDVCL